MNKMEDEDFRKFIKGEITVDELFKLREQENEKTNNFNIPHLINFYKEFELKQSKLDQYGYYK